MFSLTSLVEKSLNRRFAVFHPTDFSVQSEVAFAHALKIALKAKAQLELMHVNAALGPQEPRWLNFPEVRATLARWNVLPEGTRREELAKIGLRVRKISMSGKDPVEAMLRRFERFPPDLIVLATHQCAGLGRWFANAVAEPLARRSGAMTLFVPNAGPGFVSLENGAVTLKRILIPIDHNPDPQTAVDKALLLASGLESAEGDLRLLHVSEDETLPAVDPPLLPGWLHETVLRRGDVVSEILRIEKDWRPDLVVLATQGHAGLLDVLRGSTTERVLRGVHCPLLAVPARI